MTTPNCTATVRDKLTRSLKKRQHPFAFTFSLVPVYCSFYLSLSLFLLLSLIRLAHTWHHWVLIANYRIDLELSRQLSGWNHGAYQWAQASEGRKKKKKKSSNQVLRHVANIQHCEAVLMSVPGSSVGGRFQITAVFDFLRWSEGNRILTLHTGMIKTCSRMDYFLSYRPLKPATPLCLSLSPFPFSCWTNIPPPQCPYRYRRPRKAMVRQT